MKTTIELPFNQFDMPPPYWRSSATIFQVIDALKDLVEYLKRLTEIHSKVEAALDEHFKKYPEQKDDDEEFGIICEPLWEIEHKINMKCELAVFMTSIHLEDTLNRVIVYNLDKDIAEITEKLNTSEKLQMIAVLLAKESVKSKQPFEGIKKFSTWRNAYAHGHCTDRPTKSLRHNHLISPDDYPSVPKEVEFLMKRMEDYFAIVNFLKLISINNYTKGDSVEYHEIKDLVNEINKFKFAYNDNGDIYNITKEGTN